MFFLPQTQFFIFFHVRPHLVFPFLSVPVVIVLTCSTGNRNVLPSLKAKRTSESGEGSESGSLIVYNGAMVDVGSMMQKLDKSEKAREEIEQKLMLQDTKIGQPEPDNFPPKHSPTNVSNSPYI